MMTVIIENAPVLFKCGRCAWVGQHFAALAAHVESCRPVAHDAPMPAAPLANSTAPIVALDLTHRPARPLESRAKARPVGEIELAPSETVSVAPVLASRAIEPDAPPTPRMAPARPVTYCRRCGVALPTGRVRATCENCGATLA